MKTGHTASFPLSATAIHKPRKEPRSPAVSIELSARRWAKGQVGTHAHPTSLLCMVIAPLARGANPSAPPIPNATKTPATSWHVDPLILSQAPLRRIHAPAPAGRGMAYSNAASSPHSIILMSRWGLKDPGTPLPNSGSRPRDSRGIERPHRRVKGSWRTYTHVASV
jgi:hypothetical protein